MNGSATPTRVSPRPKAPLGAAMAFAGALAAVMLAAPVPQAVAQPAGAPVSFADLAEQLSPAVVNISTTSAVAAPSRPNGPQLPDNSPFRELFPDLFDGQPGQRGPARPRSSLGSGFVISADGFIVTNNHVIDGADEIVANFADGSSLDAVLIGTDPKTDIALLKVSPEEDLTHVPFGDSEAARVGDWVMAIGNPFGLGGSVSAGIISASNRDINAGPYDDFIQTDAAINRGNSGGPLFNMAGEVIGVNTAIISPSGGSIGIGFSVPANIARNVVAQLQEFGQTRRGWLGVQIQPVTDELAESLGLSSASGALVASVVEDGPAAEGAVAQGDVILRFDGRQVDEMRDLPRMVAETDVGKAVEVVVWRKGERETLSVELGLLEEEGPVLNASVDLPAGESEAQAETLGMTLVPMTPARRESLGIAADVDGVIVEEVDAAGAAAAKNIRPGDVVVEVGQEPVSSPEEVLEKTEAAREAGRKSVLLLVSASGQMRFIAVSLED